MSGLANYDEMTDDNTVRISIANTLIYVAIVVPASVALGLGAALLIDADGSLRSFYSAAYFLPVMATLIAMAIVWGFMLDPRIGAVNFALRHWASKPLDFLNDRKIVLFTLCGIGIWQSVGFNMVLFMAGLTAIPSELYEAASIDGARRGASRFALVTWPMLAPVTLFTVVITAIRAFQVFDTVQVLTERRPQQGLRGAAAHDLCRGLRLLPRGLRGRAGGCVPGVHPGAVGDPGVFVLGRRPAS